MCVECGPITLAAKLPPLSSYPHPTPLDIILTSSSPHLHPPGAVFVKTSTSSCSSSLVDGGGGIVMLCSSHADINFIMLIIEIELRHSQ